MLLVPTWLTFRPRNACQGHVSNEQQSTAVSLGSLLTTNGMALLVGNITVLLGNVMSIPVVLAVTNVSIDAQPALWYDTLPPRLL